MNQLIRKYQLEFITTVFASRIKYSRGFLMFLNGFNESFDRKMPRAGAFF